MRRGEPGSLRAVALPTEHGGWGFTLEPILLGLAVAPSFGGAGVAAAALAVFLARRPFRLLSADWRHRRVLPRTADAAKVLAVCLVGAACGVVAAALLADGPFWWPLLAALPAAAWQVAADITRRGRAFLDQATGALAMGAAAPAIALVAGWGPAPAFGLWAVLAGRALPSILFVRAMIRRARGEPAAPFATHAAHGLAVGVLAALAATGAVPWAAGGAVTVLWAAATTGLARPPVAARTLGWIQVLLGLLVVAIAVAGYRLGW